MFETVVALRVEGVSLPAVSRVEGLAWNTVARWLERAAAVCGRVLRVHTRKAEGTSSRSIVQRSMGVNASL